MKRYIYIAVVVLAGFLYSCNKSSDSSEMSPSIGGGDGPGVGGSMAKFTIANDHLFLINETELLIYNIINEASPVEVGNLEVEFGIETVFSMGSKLFIGSDDGVYIYDISNPASILYLSHYEHIRSCDPVVANDSIAFSTLNSMSSCRWQMGANQLDVIDIRNIVDPQLISSYNMEDPKGLGLDGIYLFVCNGASGMDIYDISNPYDLNRVSGITGIDSYDVIIHNNILVLIGKDGLFQYNYDNINNLELLSNILF